MRELEAGMGKWGRGVLSLDEDILKLVTDVIRAIINDATTTMESFVNSQAIHSRTVISIRQSVVCEPEIESQEISFDRQWMAVILH